MVGAIASTAISFIANVATNYLLSRLTAQDGPRLKNLEADGGDYGVPMPRAYGAQVRVVGAFIAQADIKETKHKVSDHSTIAGVVGGAATGFSVGGPVGAAIGAVAGGLLGFGAPDQYYYTYSDTLAHLLLDRTDDDPIDLFNGAKIWANGKLIFSESPSKIEDEEYGTDGKLIWRKYHKNKYFKSLRIYTGHSEQDVDVDLEDDVDEDSGYVFICYAVFEDLQLEAFGNSVPTIEYLIGVQAGETMAAAAEKICTAANIDSSRDISTTALTGDEMRGFLIDSQTSCWDALKPLLPVFAFDAGEVSGQIRFYKRSQFMRSTFALDDLGTHTYGDSPPPLYTFRRASDLDLPRETSLTFIDSGRNFQPNTMTSRRSEGNAASNVSTSLKVVLTADEAASVAALMHWDQWLGRTELSFSLSDAWIELAVGYAYGFPIGDEIVPYRITRRVRGANGVMEVEALSDESVTYTASETGTSGTVPDDDETEFEDTRLILLDMPIMSDDDDEYGYYAVMGGSGPDWARGSIQISDDGVTFATIIDQPQGAVMGDVTGTLAAGSTTGLDDTLDTTSVLTVVLLHDSMELTSATDAQLDNWANFCFVGKDGLGEYLQFKTATHVTGSTWQLTNLRRGRRGTDHAIGTHTSGEEFALLGQGGVFRIVYSDTSEWGNEFTFRGVTLHQDEADADTETFTNTGEGKRPFSPVNVEGTWDGSNNLEITWDSRSRLFAGGLGIDDNAEWDIEIITGSGRTDTVSSETFSYSAADQITDGITPGDTIQGRVRQTSDVNDGRWRDFLLLGPDDTWELEDDVTSYHLEDGTTPLALEA